MKFQKNNKYKFSLNNSKTTLIRKEEVLYLFNSLEDTMTVVGRLEENETFTFLEEKIVHGIRSVRGAIYGIKVKNSRNINGWILFRDLNTINKNTSFYDSNSNKVEILNNSSCLN